MAGLEPARAFYSPTDFKSVASAISPHRLGVGGAYACYSTGENEFRDAPGDDVDNSCFIGNIRDIQTQNADAIAEVAKVTPSLIVRDKSGEVYTVRYEAVNAMLLNEFLKEHQKVEDQDRKLKEQQATIARLRKDLQATGGQQLKQIEALATSLQKVNAHLELMKPAPQTVLNY